MRESWAMCVTQSVLDLALTAAESGWYRGPPDEDPALPLMSLRAIFGAKQKEPGPRFGFSICAGIHHILPWLVELPAAMGMFSTCAVPYGSTRCMWLWGTGNTAAQLRN